MNNDPSSLHDARLKGFSVALYQLAHAAIDNDWGAMQRALKLFDGVVPGFNQPTRTIQQSELKILLNQLMPDQHYLLMTKHCMNCHEVEEKHVDAKCLFSSQTFVACPVWLNEATIVQCKAKRKIDAIKEFRAASGLGLKDAKDVVDAEMQRHGW